MTPLYSLASRHFHNHIIKNCKNSGGQLVPLMLKFLGMYLREIIDCVLIYASIHLL